MSISGMYYLLTFLENNAKSFCRLKRHIYLLTTNSRETDAQKQLMKRIDWKMQNNSKETGTVKNNGLRK